MIAGKPEQNEDAAVLFRVCSEIAAHREELVQRLQEHSTHEFLHMGFDQNGEWLDVVIVRPHIDRPEDLRRVPVSMFLAGVKGAYGSPEEEREAARSTVLKSINFFLPQDITWSESQSPK